MASYSESSNTGRRNENKITEYYQGRDSETNNNSGGSRF